MGEPITTIIVTAFHAEAVPFIEYFELKKRVSAAPFDVFARGEMALVITGVGKVKAAIATTALLASRVFLSEESIHSKSPNSPFEKGGRGDIHNTLYPFPISRGVCAINVGIAGARRTSFEIGEIVLVHQVVDAASGRHFFPDMVVSQGITEAPLVTVDRPAEASKSLPIERCVVDMEGAGFFEAASTFLAPSAIASLKVVSDHMEGERLKKIEVTRLVERQVPRVADFVAAVVKVNTPKLPILGESEIQWLTKVSTALRLTVSQTRQLKEAAVSYLVRSGQPLPELTTESLMLPTSKGERSARFESIRDKL